MTRHLEAVLPVEVGQSWKIYFSPNNPNNRILHIRAIIDDEYYAFRVWSKRKQYWYYTVEHYSFFKYYQEEGYMKLKKGKKHDT